MLKPLQLFMMFACQWRSQVPDLYRMGMLTPLALSVTFGWCGRDRNEPWPWQLSPQPVDGMDAVARSMEVVPHEKVPD